MPVYSLIAYKHNNVDTCRGCVMDRFDSDFELRTTVNETELIEAWATLLKRNRDRERGDASYELTLLVDGADADLESELTGDDWDAWNAKNDLRIRFESAAQAAYEKRVETEQAAQALAAQRATQQAEAAREAARLQAEMEERATFERLKVKFEGEGTRYA